MRPLCLLSTAAALQDLVLHVDDDGGSRWGSLGEAVVHDGELVAEVLGRAGSGDPS